MGALWSPWTQWIFYSWPPWSASAAQLVSTYSLDMSKIMLIMMTINRFTGICFPLGHKTCGGVWLPIVTFGSAQVVGDSSAVAVQNISTVAFADASSAGNASNGWPIQA
ncbi:unnamed protein product [Sphagnum balticum]